MLTLITVLYVVCVLTFPKRILDEVTDEDYLTRYYLFRSPWLNVYLHRIHREDKDRHLHNHPWPWAFAYILRGGYQEQRASGYHIYKAGDKNDLTGDIYHRIVTVRPNTWTLFVCGPYERSWGFDVDGVHIDSEEYLT